jgi:hypothetical protein
MTFSLKNIKFKKEGSTLRTETSIFSSKSGRNVYRYPIDLGEGKDKGHYILFNINKQLKSLLNNPITGESNNDQNPFSQFDVKTKIGRQSQPKTFLNNLNELSRGVRDRFSNATSLNEVQNESGTLEESLLIGLFRGVISSATPENVREKLENATVALRQGFGLRTIQKTTDSIAIYMPDTLAFSQRQNFSPIQLGGGGLATVGTLFDVGKSMMEDYKKDMSIKDLLTNAIGNLSPFLAAKIAQQFGGSGLAVFASASGTVINPQIELIYSSPELRTFRFEFMLYPRSQKEALEVSKIIDTFRFHQLPEIMTEKNNPGAFLLVPPSEFDISFYYNGKENSNISKISTCVLTSLDIDYAPNGFSAYEVISDRTVSEVDLNRGEESRLNTDVNYYRTDVSKGGTGMPTAIRLSLDFMETEFLTKESFLVYEQSSLNEYRK